MKQPNNSYTPYQHPWSLEDFRSNAHEMVDYICDYYQQLQQQKPSQKTFPVLSNVEIGYLAKVLPESPPQQSEPYSAILKDVNEHIFKGVTHWQDPNFFAFFSANSSYPAMLGDMLSTAFGVIGFNWITSPACTELETIVMNWVAKMLDLPLFYLTQDASEQNQGTGGGIIQGTASEAVIVCLLAAKARKMQHVLKKTITASDAPTVHEETDFLSKITMYFSDQAHSSIKKAAMIAGIPLEHCRVIPSNHLYEMDVKELEKQLQKDVQEGLIPFFVVATIGTTSTTAIDPIDKIGAICEQFDCWMHIDAAFMGSQLICPEFRQEQPFITEGLAKSHSFNFNPHKWMLTNFDCSCLFVKERVHLLNALSITPVYLRNKASETGKVFDYRDWQLGLGRRFRSLKLWFVIRSYGVQGLQQYIQHHLQLAQYLETLLQQSDYFELITPRTSALLCFRIKNSTNEQNKLLMDTVNHSGKVYLVNTILKNNLFTLRLAICGTFTTREHVEECWNLLCTTVQSIMQQHS